MHPYRERFYNNLKIDLHVTYFTMGAFLNVWFQKISIPKTLWFVPSTPQDFPFCESFTLILVPSIWKLLQLVEAEQLGEFQAHDCFQIICNYPIPLLKSLKIETIYLWKLLLELYCLYKCGNKAKLCNLH